MISKHALSSGYFGQ